MPASRGYSQPRIEPTSFTSPALAGGFFTINVSFMRRENKSFEMPKGSSGNPSYFEVKRLHSELDFWVSIKNVKRLWTHD